MFKNNTNNNIIDNINNCTISDIYIRDAIADITVGGDLSLNGWWTSEHKISYKDGIQDISIEKNHFFSINPDSVWKPVFINANTNEQKISDIGVYNKATLGTNEYLKFQPYFKKYFRTNNTSLVIPWKLNSDEFPYTCTQGVVCWVNSTLSDNTSETNSVSWSAIPNFVPFYKEGGPYLKLDKDRLLLPNNSTEQIAPSRGPFLENNFITTTPSGIFGADYEDITYSFNEDFDKYQNNTNMWIADGDVYSYTEDTGGSDTEEKTYISAPLYQHYTSIYHAITILRKRSFSRDLNQSRKYKNLAKYLASSPFITKFCIQAMSKDDIQNIVYQYINSFISLYDALVSISTILNNNSNISTIDYNLQQRQSNNLIKTSSDLFHKLKNKYGMKLAVTNGAGSIEYTEDLPNKDDIAITNVFTINTKNANHYVNNDSSYVSLCQNINVNNFTIGSRIENEVEVLDPNKFDRSVDILSRTKDGNFVKSNFLPLYDSIEPKWTSEAELNIAMEFVDNLGNKGPNNKEWDPENIVYKYGSVDISNNPIPQASEEWILSDILSEQGYVQFKIFDGGALEIIKEDPYFSIEIEANKQFSFLWEQVSGPPIKFTDTNISENGIFDTSSSETVKVIFSDFARYTIKCNIFSPFGRFVKYKTFFVINGENKFNSYTINEYGSENRTFVTYTEDPTILNTYTPERRNFGGPILSEKIQQAIPIIPNRYNFKFVKTNGFKKIAINARGLVWFIDTSFKVARYGYLERYIEKLSGPIYKVSCNDPARLLGPIPELKKPFDIYNDSDARSRLFSLEYIISSSDSSVTLYLDKIILENIRNGSEECSKCLSTYGSDMIGVTSFGGVGKKTLSPDRINNGFTLSNLKDNNPVIYSMPDYSLDYAPKIHKYGRYLSDDFMNAIVGSNDLSDNPLVSTSSFGSTNVVGSILPDSNVSQSKNKIYPSTTGFNLAAERTNEYSEEDQPGPDVPIHKLCYQKALSVIASGDIDRDFYIDFTKGVFHPNSGWINSDINKSYVLKFNPGARDTFSFKGPAIDKLTTSDISYDVFSPNLVNASIKQSLLPNIFSSSVSVGIAEHIRWDPVCECPPGVGASDEAIRQFSLKSPFRILQNQRHKEYGDQPGYSRESFKEDKTTEYVSYHGYRILGGGFPKGIEPTKNETIDVNDEFVFNKKNAGYKNNTFQYEFAVTGPANKIAQVGSGLNDLLNSPSSLPENISNETLNLRDPRVNNFQIKDVEVNLNFLNYVNTQDLIIWLEVTPSASERRRQTQSRSSRPSPITAPAQFVNQNLPTTIQRKDTDVLWSTSVTDSNVLLNTSVIGNTGVGSYLKSLIDVNSNNPGENFKIYLLNQEYIQNNKYNLSIKFSDHSDVYCKTNDFLINQNSECIGPHVSERSIIVDNNGTIAPTLAAMKYHDIDHHINSNILKKNQLYATNNTFSKLYGKPLFLNPPPSEDRSCGEQGAKQQGPSLDSQTIFTLKIATVDEPDIMNNYDNIINSAILTNFIPEHNTQTSAKMFSNLCNWEIILHTDSTKKHAPHSNDEHTYGSTDVLSLIKYHKPPNDDGYYGYNFIADLTDKQFLLPIGNINAPHQYIQDFDICNSAIYDISKGNLLLDPPSFPTAAIVSILAGIAAAFAAGGIGLAGFAGFDVNDQGYRDVINFFQEGRRWAELDRRLGQIYSISHGAYPFGSSEKILLNISKEGCFWYNVEGVIFRLSNTPIIDEMKFKPLTLPKINVSEPTDSTDQLVQLLSEFKYEVISDIFDTIDTSFIKYDLSLTCDQLQNSIDTQTITTDNGTYSLSAGDIFKITVINTDTDGDGEINDCEYDGSVVNEGLYVLSKTDDIVKWSLFFSDFLNNKELVTINNMLSFHNWWTSEIIVKINNPIAFDLFNLGDDTEVFNNTSRTTSHIFQINGKAKILLNNQYCTILTLSTTSSDIPIDPITGEDRTALDFVKQNNLLRNDSRNTIALINPVPDTSGNIHSYPWSQWKFESDYNVFYDTENISNGIIPQIGFSTNSRGSYGDMSPKLQKNYLHYVVHKNKIDKLYELFDNEHKYKKIYNNIWYSPSSSGTQENILGPSQGYSYSLNDILSTKEVFNDDIFNFIYTSTSNNGIIDNLSTTLQEKSLYKTLLMDNKYEIIYLSNNNFSRIYNNYTATSSINVEGVGTLNSPIVCDDIPIDRITKLESDVDETLLTNYTGNINQYSAFFQSYPSIKTALAYYDSILGLGNTSLNITKLYNIKNNIELLFEERNSLIKLKNCIHSSDIANIKYNILNSDNNVNKYYITKTINNNYYWIHIDPKQSCAISEELRPKVLKATKYSCKFLNPNINFDRIENNICSFNTASKAANGGDEDVKTFDNMSFPGDAVLGIPYGYYIPSGIIEQNKTALQSKHSVIADWKEQSVYRTFYMNSTVDIVNYASNPDYVIYVEEIYDVAVPIEHTMTVKQALEEEHIKNDGSADINTVPGWGESCGRAPGGFGLINTFGERYFIPTRLCNIFNLDDDNSIKVKFRKVPRILRGVDFLGTIFRHGATSQYRQINYGSPLQPIETTIGQGSLNNQLYVWQCLELDKDKKLVKTKVSDLMAIMNEMAFRAFYGSADGIENRDRKISQNQYSDQLIPFEFFSKPPPEEP